MPTDNVNAEACGLSMSMPPLLREQSREANIDAVVPQQQGLGPRVSAALQVLGGEILYNSEGPSISMCAGEVRCLRSVIVVQEGIATRRGKGSPPP
jgi:hypothetical protein